MNTEIGNESGRKRWGKGICAIVMVTGTVLVLGKLYRHQTRCINSRYETGSPYMITGTVSQARKIGPPSRRSYRVIIYADCELPDGTHVYDSHLPEDFIKAYGYEGEHVRVTVSPDGIIADIENAAGK